MTILIFFAVLVLLILVHEFGHFIVAKKSGIRVDEFGIGFPPKITGKKYGETEYTLNWLPIGGFVRIWGEDPTEAHYTDGPESERSFVKQPRYIQAAVLVAGVAMNVLLAYVLYVASYMIGMPTAVGPEAVAAGEETQLIVTSVIEQSPAGAVLQAGDEIVALGNASSQLADGAITPDSVSSFIALSGESEVVMDVVRRGERLEIVVTPEAGIIPDDPERIAAGFTMSLVGTVALPLHEALVAGAVRTYHALTDVVVGLWSIISGAVAGTADISNIAGPVGIVGLVGDAAALGFVWLMMFSAFISLNLAVINLLPIPALDGGRLVFVAIEAITRRPINPKFATRLNQIGFVALLALMLMVTVNDVLRIVG